MDKDNSVSEYVVGAIIESKQGSKQKEIREAIDTYVDDGCLFPDRSCNALGSGYCSSYEEAYKCLMERLDKVGVVIKVEDWLPMRNGMTCTVESLIERGRNEQGRENGDAVEV